MLEKRQSLDSSKRDIASDKKLFVQHHLPELLTENGRMKYYKAYEFIRKQVNLQQYWRRALTLYLKHHLRGFAVHWGDLIDFFEMEGCRPLGLGRIILELSKNRELAILKDETEFKKVAQMIGNDVIDEEGSGSFWTGVVSFFKRSTEETMQDSTIIVHIGLVNSAFNKSRGAIKNIFDERILVEENEFNQRFSTEFKLTSLDQKLLIHVLVDKKVIFKYKDKKRMFYCIEEPNAENKFQLDVEKEDVLLSGRVDQVSQQLEAVIHEIETKTNQALDCKRRNRKTQAITILAELRHLRQTADRLRTEKLYIEKIRHNLNNTHSQKEFANVLKEVNRILSENEYVYDEIMKNHDQMKELEQQNEYINHLVSGGDREDDLEDMYKELNEMSASKIMQPERSMHPIVEEERGELSASEAQRKSSQRLKESSLKDINNLTESELMLKRFTNFEE